MRDDRGGTPNKNKKDVECSQGGVKGRNRLPSQKKKTSPSSHWRVFVRTPKKYGLLTDSRRGRRTREKRH